MPRRAGRGKFQGRVPERVFSFQCLKRHFLVSGQPAEFARVPLMGERFCNLWYLGLRMACYTFANP